MKTLVSRRSLLIGLGGLAATSLVWSIGGFGTWPAARRTETPLPGGGYVDYEGWMMTVDDKTKLLATAPIKPLDNTNLPGHDIANKVVADVDACALWCILDDRCQSFAFAKPASTAVGPNMCWIKDSVPDAVASEYFVSGIVE